MERLKRSWRRLRDDPPGERFQRRYERYHSGGSSPMRRWGTLGLGVVIFAAGIFFLPAPGPGTIVLALGAGLIAQESSHAARALDWTELRIRRLLSWGRRLYDRAPRVGRAALIIVAVALAGGAAYLAYRVVFGGS